MTVILVLLCLAIAGRELYLAFDRRRSGVPASSTDVIDLRARLNAERTARGELRVELAEFKKACQETLDRLDAGQTRHGELLAETDARIRSLIAQINDRMLPEVNTQLAQHRDEADLLRAELARLRGHLVRRLDQAVAASLGADPVDTVDGVLGGDVATARQGPLVRSYERCAKRYGLGVELAQPSPSAGEAPWQVRYYLSGRSPRGLEHDFIELIRMLRAGDADPAAAETGPARALLDELQGAKAGVAQIGPWLVVRTPEALLCGVLPLAELRRGDPSALPADPVAAAVRLHGLHGGRFCDLTDYR